MWTKVSKLDKIIHCLDLKSLAKNKTIFTWKRVGLQKVTSTWPKYISEMERIVDSHFHIWDFSLRATYPKTDASFDWPDASLPVIHRNIQVKNKDSTKFSLTIIIASYTQECSGNQHDAWHYRHLNNLFIIAMILKTDNIIMIIRRLKLRRKWKNLE